jgi:hypothetical protein
VLERLPYAGARAATPGEGPDPRRYRDARQVYQTAGLLYEGDGGCVHVTALGHATRRWLPLVHEKNARVLGRHAAFALAACQLRNPTGAGGKYAEEMTVFPFAFIWRAMLALDNRLSSDELNRAIFRVQNEDELATAIDRIHEYRQTDDLAAMGEETETGPGKNDRIISWMSIASFGWMLICDKSADRARTHYTIPATTLPVVREASRIRHRHRDFKTVPEYVEYLASAAALPGDLR